LLTINGVKMKKLNVKKGFSLIELLVVIAIIGILSAVGITAYSGYTANAKEQASRTQFAQLVSLVNAEMAKCSLGSGTYTWGGNCSDKISTSSGQNIANHMVNNLGMKSPYDQTIVVGTDQDNAAFVYYLTAAADPTGDGDFTIYCDATADTCNIRNNPGNGAAVLSQTLTQE
jgi:prepilin-type N-terminal cleavage/methylation domain-containing protein